MRRFICLSALLLLHCKASHAQTMGTTPKGLRLLAPCHYSYGTAVAGNGAVWFTEYGHQQLRQLNTNGTIAVRRIGMTGMFGLAIDGSNNVFVGRELGDVSNPSKITRITAAGAESDIVTGITRPRQLTTDNAGNVYFATESPSRISRWNQSSGTVDIVISGLPYSAEGVAVASDGTIYFSEYGNPEFGVPGTVKKRATNGTITTLVDSIWRCRGLVLDAAQQYLYLCTESDQADHGNAGLLAKINVSNGTWTKALEGIDYPQFPSLGTDGNIYFSLTRDSWVGMYNPAASTTDSSWSSNSSVKIGISEGQWSSSGTGASLTINVGALSFSGMVSSANSNGTVHGWIRIPENLIALDTSELYTGCLPAEHPTPGIYRLPEVKYHTDSGSCLISVIALRGHTGQRWPMQNVGTCNESPAAGFSEKPVAYLVYFAWNNKDRIDTILSPSYTEAAHSLDIIKGSEPGWIYSGTPFSSSGQTWLNAGKYNTSPASSSWAEQDLGAFAGKSKYIYVMWHKNGPYRPNAARYRLYDYTEDKFNGTKDQTKHADNISHSDDTYSGWYLLGNKKFNITPGTRLRISQDDPVDGTEYLQSDAIMLSDYPIVDNTSLGTATDFESMPVLSVTSSGSSGVGSHWGMQGLGYQYTVTNGKSFATKLDPNVFADLPAGDYYIDVSWDYLNSDNVNATNAKYAVNGTNTSDAINQNRSAANQGGSFQQGNSVGKWSGFYRLNGTFSHSTLNPIIISNSYNSTTYSSKKYVLDMIRFVPVSGFPGEMRTANFSEPPKNEEALPSLHADVLNYPNPFSAFTHIAYSIPSGAKVSLKIFNAVGAPVATVADGFQPAGQHVVVFNGNKYPPGVYYYVLTIDGKVITKKMLIAK